MFKNVLLAFVAVALVTATGCGGKSVDRVDTDKVIDLSGNWNDTDSRLVAETMVKSLIDDSWYDEFRAKHDRNPAIRVGVVRVRTEGDLVNTKIFTNDIRKSMVRSRAIDVFSSNDEAEDTRSEIREQQEHATEDTRKTPNQEIGVDYIMSGTISVQNDQEGRKQVRFYQTELSMKDVQTRKLVWTETHSLKKYISY